MSELVSVIIATWNREKLLERAVKSALAQTYRNLEILVCDDGSTDNTFEMLERIGDDRIKWIPGEHSGLPAVPKNRGLKKCKGKWIAILDSDDAWTPVKIEKQLKALNKTGLKASCSNAWRYVEGKNTNERYIFWNKDIIAFEDLLYVNIVINCSAIFHSSLLDKIHQFPEDERFKVGEDYAFWIRASALTDFAYINEPLILYTDNRKKSVRSDYQDFGGVHNSVLDDFIDWAYEKEIDEKYIKKAKNWRLYGAKRFFPVAVNVLKKAKRNLFKS